MPTSVANFDIAGAADRLVTFANEVIASQSARQAEFNEHDRGRASAYLDRLESYVEVIANPANPLDNRRPIRRRTRSRSSPAMTRSMRSKTRKCVTSRADSRPRTLS